MAAPENPLVSVIVPVYNVEDYLRQALDSLLAQTLGAGEMEIICVDDGSSDSSPAILAEYAEAAAVNGKFPFTVITQPRNFGYGRAMNTGLAAARGEYVGLLEPDDFVDAAMFENLLGVARKHDADVVKGNYFDHIEGVEPDRFEDALGIGGWAYDVPLCAKDDDTLLFIRACLWSAIYKRSLIEDNGIRFAETPGASFQDTSFAVQVAICAQRYVLVRDAYVHYRLDNASSSSNSVKKEFCVYDEIAAIEAFVNAEAKRRERFRPAAIYKCFWLYDWNRARIGACEATDIAEGLMSSTLRRAAYEGVLERRFFDDREWAEVQRLVSLDVKDPAQRISQAREEVVAEYEGSWSYRLGRALLAPARLLRSRAERR